MGIATFLEKGHGQAFAATHIYGAWWFVGLWAALSLLSVVVLLRRKVQQRPAVFLLHGAFLVILALIAVRCLLLRPRKEDEQLLRLTALSRLLLYPAVALLSAGIFVGAVWANISWGSYWSWDPKETWALITLMVYAVPLHGLPRTDSPRAYQLYILLALLTVLMTYFGVNYFLSGMHAYS